MTTEEIEAISPELNLGMCMKDPGPCDICGEQTSLMYGIYAKGFDHYKPLAVICSDGLWMINLINFWNNLSVDERVRRFNERCQRR